jgi:hypothetical protein
MTEESEKEDVLRLQAEAKRAKKEASESLIPKKKLYTVKLEVQAPVELTYRVWAEDPMQAVDLIKSGQLSGPPRPILSKRRNVKATVYKYGTVMIEFIKKYT